MPTSNADLSQSLATRLQFLADIRPTTEGDELEGHVNDLLNFVAPLRQGNYFVQKIKALTERPQTLVYDEDWAERAKGYDQQYREQLRAASDPIRALVDELLRLQ